MKKPFALVSAALCVACVFGTFGLAGCSCSSSSGKASASPSAAASAATGQSATSSASPAASAAATATATPGPLDRAVEFATDEGVTSLDYTGFQTAANKVEFNMTLAEVREIMGASGTPLTDPIYQANTVAWYTSDRAEAFMAVFNDSGDNATLVSCTATVE